MEPRCAATPLHRFVRRMAWVALVTALVIPTGLAGTVAAPQLSDSARAADIVFAVGVFSSATGPRNRLNKVGARLLSGGSSTDIVCTNARNDNGALAGNSICAGTTAGSLATHPFCGCQMRRGLAFAFYSHLPVHARARQHW